MKGERDFKRATSFAITVIAMVTLCAMLAGLFYALVRMATRAEGDQHAYLARLAALVLAALVLAALILLSFVVRYIGRRVTARSGPPKRSEHVSAWLEAGRRLKPEQAPPVEGYEDPEDDSPQS